MELPHIQYSQESRKESIIVFQRKWIDSGKNGKTTVVTQGDTKKRGLC